VVWLNIHKYSVTCRLSKYKLILGVTLPM